MLTPEEEESRGGRWRPGGGGRWCRGVRRWSYNASPQGGQQRRTLAPEEEAMIAPDEDDGVGCWCPRRRAEYKAGTEEKKGGAGRWRQGGGGQKMTLTPEEKKNGRGRWRPRSRRRMCLADVRGGEVRIATLASEEEEDKGRRWNPRRRRTEEDAGARGGEQRTTLAPRRRTTSRVPY